MGSIVERIDAITAIPDAYRRVDPPPPKSVKIELTGRCNYACAFCARSMKLRDQKDMDRGLFERLLLEMREAGVEEIGLFYLGESFLVKWLPEAIWFAKHEAKFPYVFLTSNASLSTPGKVKACMAAGLDSLKWSLNYADAEQFVEVARVKPVFFQRMIDNIKLAHGIRADFGYNCGLYASYIQFDGEQAKRMAARVDEIRPYVDEVYGLPLYNQAGFVTAEEEARGWAPTAGNRGRVGALRDPLPCWALWSGHITTDGKLSACCFDHDDSFAMADLTEHSFLDAWNSQAFQELRAAHLEKRVDGTVCEGCVAYR
jgi:MoaA/NifB/PqqE/SkfB family radical SAM enzyme